jgi:hypothetical protein
MPVVSRRVSVPKQKVNGNNFNGIVDEMGTLVIDHSEQTT